MNSPGWGVVHTWLSDEVFVKIGGRLQSLWRAVDQDGSALDTLVQSRRNKKAAARFFRKLPRGLKYAPCAAVAEHGARVRQRVE